MLKHRYRLAIKIILTIIAGILPWTIWPSQIMIAIGDFVGRPAIKLALPAPEIAEKPVENPAWGKKFTVTAMDDVSYLASSEAKGRRAGTSGEAKAMQYLMIQLSDMGLEPKGQINAGYVQAFTIPPMVERFVNGRLTFRPGSQGLRIPAVNLIGSLPGENPNEVILISAHYDHLGTFQGKLYPGANDNASGVGCVLDVMRRLIEEGKTPKKTIVLALWSAEEMGFVGSSAFVRNPTVPLKDIEAVLNVDTVGNGKLGDFALWGEGNNIAVKTLQQAAQASKASAQLTSGNGHNSDQVSFANVNIPAVTLMSKDWLVKNHTPEDTVKFIEPNQIKLAEDILFKAIKHLAY